MSDVARQCTILILPFLHSYFAILALPMDTLGEVQNNAPRQMKLDYLWLCSRASGNPGFIWFSVFWKRYVLNMALPASAPPLPPSKGAWL